MKRVDFFQLKCDKPNERDRYTITSGKEFGICDDNNREPAYLNWDDKTKWIAHVENPNSVHVTFMPIDNCLEILEENGDMAGRCDVMLTYTDNIVFVELKNQRADWISDTIKQLKYTIDVFRQNHNLENYNGKRKRAFAANKRHPSFHYSHKVEMKRFHADTTVYLWVQATIII